MEAVEAVVGEVAARSHGIFALHHLEELGLDKDVVYKRVRSGRWHVVHDGVFRVAGAPRTWRGDLLAACWAGGIRTFASHRSATALWKLPGGRQDIIEVVCPRWRRARHDGLLVHESTKLDPIDTIAVEAIPCTTVERTLFDLASLVPLFVLDDAFDSALRRDLTTLGQLLRTSARLATQGRRGGRKFRTAVEERTGRAARFESPPERRIARLLVSHGLPEPAVQYVVRDQRGEFIGRVDLAYPQYRIAIEYDSYQEHVGKIALVNDSRRRNELLAAGWTALVATAADVRDGCSRLAGNIRRAREVASLNRR